MDKTTNVPMTERELKTLIARLNGKEYTTHRDQATMATLMPKLWAATDKFTPKEGK